MDSLQQPSLRRERQPGEALVLWLPVFLGLGASGYFLLPFEPPWLLSIAALMGAIIIALATRSWREIFLWRYAVVCIVLVSLGFLVAQIRTHIVDAPLITKSIFNAEVAGDIQSIERMGNGWRIVIDHASLNGEAKNYVFRVTLRQKEMLPEIGGHIDLVANLMAPSPPLLPGMYDFQFHAFFQRMSGYGYTTKVLSYTLPALQQNQSRLETYRNFIARRVYANVQQPEAGVTVSLLNGQRGGIRRQTTQSLQQSGLFHIISISGLHIGIMAGLVFFLARFLMACSMRLALTWPIKKIAAGLAMLAIALYMMVVGDDPATLRSVITASVALIAIMVDREAINLRVVAIAAIIILLCRPESVFDIGFQLSFAAVTALVAFYYWTDGVWRHMMWKESLILRGLLPIILSVITSIVATLATAPLVFLHFQQIPLLAMLANALATPVVGFVIMPGTFLAYLLLPFPVLGDGAVIFMSWGVTALLKISDFVTSLPLAVWRAPAIPVSSVMLMMASFFLCIVLHYRFKILSVLPFVAGALILISFKPPDLALTGNRIVLSPLREADMLYIDGKVDRFSKNLFLQYTGVHYPEYFGCEGDVCNFEKKGKKIAIIRTIPALKQACDQHADMILTRWYLDDPCPNALNLDRHITNKNGGILVWLDPLRVETVYDSYDRRPWQQKEDWSAKGRRGKVAYDRADDTTER